MWYINRAMSKTPVPQIRRKGKAFPWSKYGCRLACAEIVNHNFILPEQCSLRPLPDRDSHPQSASLSLHSAVCAVYNTGAEFPGGRASPLEDTSHRLQLFRAYPSFIPIPQSGQSQSHVGCSTTGHHHKFQGLDMELQV